MESLLPFDVLSRWIHVGGAIAVLGGSVFIRFVLMPAVSELPDDQREALHERVMSRWRRLVGAGIGLLLLSGMYNFVRAVPHHSGQPLYHALMGIKILLAIVVFFLASALAGRSKAFDGLRAKARTWIVLTIVLSAAVVAIAGYLKVAVKPVSAEPPEPDGPVVSTPANPPAPAQRTM